MLAVSTLSGLLWDRFGASQTFLVGTVFSALALVAIACRPSE
jgi:hypothetical protein